MGSGLFVENLVHDPFFYLSWVGVLCFSICLHEYSHAITAYKLGDDTAARSGHLSLNPLVQLGTSSLVMLFLAGIAWGSVPVQPSRYRSRRAWAAVAVAGPLANLLLAILAGLLMLLAGAFLKSARLAAPLLEFSQTAGLVNATFFVYNLLPVPVFDGWSIASLLFPRLEEISPRLAQQITLGVLIAVFLTPVGDWIWRAGTGLFGVIVDLEVRCLGGVLGII